MGWFQRDLIKDVKAMTDGGPQVAIVAAGDGCCYLPTLLIKEDIYSGVIDLGKALYLHATGARVAVRMPAGVGLLNALVPLLVAKVQ